MKTTVIGAGASGLSFALLWGDPVTIFESDMTVGGHARSLTGGGYLWDRGPHMMFSRDKAILKFMVDSLGSNVHKCRRNNVVKVAGRTLRYPIENDLGSLPRQIATECLVDFVNSRVDADRGQAENLDDWFRYHFGDALTDLYFRPYNEKVWNVALGNLSMLWAERIPNPPVEDVVRGAMGHATEGYVHQLFYNYPLRGGFGALMDAWAEPLPKGSVNLGYTLDAVTEASEGWQLTFTNGHQEVTDTLVSTLPLPVLCRITTSCPKEVTALADSLIVNPMIVANYGFAEADPNEFTAVYIPDDDFLVNRVSFPAVYSPMNAPAGHHLVQAEITTAPESAVMSLSDDEISSHVLPGLRSRGLAPDVPPDFTSIERYDRAYIVYDQGYEERLAPVLDWFEERRIFPHGRFGSHNYLNVDGCVRQSAELVKKLGKDCSDDFISDFFADCD